MEFSTYTLPNGIRGIHRQVRNTVAHCALVIGAAAFVVPMFHAGSSAPETASAPTADTAALEAPAEEEMTLEAAEAPAEAMPETSPAEPAEQKTRTLPGADCFTVVPESVTRTSADFTLTNEEDAVLALRSEYWLETAADVESDEVSEPDGRIRAGIDRLHTAL